MNLKSDNNTRAWIIFGIMAIGFVCVGTMIVFGRLNALGLLEAVPTSEATEVVDPTASIEVPTPTEEVNLIPFEAVVQIRAMYEENNTLKVGWTGSGTIISPDGLILTNAHVVVTDRYFSVDALGIALTEKDDQPPVLKYYAEVLQADENLDIAVIKITKDVNGNPIDSQALNLPFVPFGDADTLKLGDQIIILGYPGIGGDTITLTRGEVGGFTSQPGYGDRAFIKTSATIAGGNSGGLAADVEGRLIGVPTQLGYGGDDQFVDCRLLADTNRDGVINDEDSCVPTGGFINALRPINLAFPMIAEAQNGQVNIVWGNEGSEDAELPEGGAILFQEDFSNSSSNLWASFSSENGSAEYFDDEYRIQILSDNFLIWTRPSKSFTDVVITVDVRTVVSAGDADFGVICRYQDADNFYGLEISEDGYFVIWKIVEGETYNLISWEASASVPRGAGFHTITAACVDDVLSISADGEFLAQATDDTFDRGDVGFIVGTWENGGITVAFDNFVVREPTP